MSSRDDGRLQLPLPEAYNVDDLKKRDRLVRRLRKIRANAVLEKNTLLYWNRTHPNEEPIDTTFEDELIAWCDGKGPLPTLPDPRYIPRGESDSGQSA